MKIQKAEKCISLLKYYNYMNLCLPIRISVCHKKEMKNEREKKDILMKSTNGAKSRRE